MELSDNCRRWLMAPAVEGRKLSRGRVVFQTIQRLALRPDVKGGGSWSFPLSLPRRPPAGAWNWLILRRPMERQTRGSQATCRGCAFDRADFYLT
jgi:hypothetical protein